MGHAELIEKMAIALQGKRALLMAGPTASGKSALAIALAQKIGAVIINADSQQVYSDLRILSARPSIEEEEASPHHLFGHINGETHYSVGQWLKDVESKLEELESKHHPLIFVGGTGLYFKALTEGLSHIPTPSSEVRKMVRALTAEQLWDHLKNEDPRASATLRPTDTQRLARALEVLWSTGKPLSFWQEHKGTPLIPFDQTAAFFISPDRTVVYNRINDRLNLMVQTGAMEEVKALKARNLSPDLPVMRAHGVPWFIKSLSGAIPIEEAIEQAKLDTRHYAKRQFTWARNQMQHWRHVSIDPNSTTITNTP
jgi:tRNA dimethylallyltransferase